MNQEKQVKKLNRRTTRSKTQFIDFKKEEMINLRLEIAQNEAFQEKPKTSRKDESCIETNLHVTDKKLHNNNSDSYKDDVFKTKVTFNNTLTKQRVVPEKKEQRTFCFKELLEWVYKKEKHDLYSKNKFDYVYKKTKGINENDIELYNDEKQIIHMRIEEDIIPRLTNNPFVQADRYLKNNENKM